MICPERLALSSKMRAAIQYKKETLVATYGTSEYDKTSRLLNVIFGIDTNADEASSRRYYDRHTHHVAVLKIANRVGCSNERYNARDGNDPADRVLRSPFHRDQAYNNEGGDLHRSYGIEFHFPYNPVAVLSFTTCKLALFLLPAMSDEFVLDETFFSFASARQIEKVTLPGLEEHVDQIKAPNLLDPSISQMGLILTAQL